MKQLHPKTILLLGLPSSLVLNLLFVTVVAPVLADGFLDWQTVLFPAIFTWLFVNVPTLAGMALIRKRIGQFDEKHLKVRAAMHCFFVCTVIAVLGVSIGYLNFDPTNVTFAIIGMLSFVVSAIHAFLAILTLINMIVRTITLGWICNSHRGSSGIAT